MALFKRGFKAVSEEKERQEKNRENMTKGLWRFFLTKDGEEADISFLTEEPINFYEHTVQANRNGKTFYDNVPCSGADCPLCANGDRPSFKSAWLVVDHRDYKYKDKDGKEKTGKDQLRLFVYGTKIAGQLDRKAQRYGLVGQVYTMIRIGKGTSTTYTFENGDKYKLTRKEIESLLPESLKKEYDGTMDSLYTIIENQITMLIKDTDNDSDDEEDVKGVQEDLVSVGDEDEEDTKKEDKPTRRKLFKKENSVKKPSIKSLVRKNK